YPDATNGGPCRCWWPRGGRPPNQRCGQDSGGTRSSAPVLRAGRQKQGQERGMEPGGQLDMQQLFAAAAQMQSQPMRAQQQLAEHEVGGTAGGGLVTVTVNGQGELVDVTISKDAIDPSDAEESVQTIADLVLAACRDAYNALGDLQADMMGPLAGGL